MTATLTQPTAVFQLTRQIQAAKDCQGSPITGSEIPQVLDVLIQKQILSHPHLTQTIQEALDDLRFGE